MTTKIQNLLKLSFVSLSLVFVACGGSDDGPMDDDGVLIEAMHTYDITFTNDTETVHYFGSVTNNRPTGMYVPDADGEEVLAIGLYDGEDFLMNVSLILDEDFVPYPLNQSAYANGLGSIIHVNDSSREGTFMGIYGTVEVSNLEIYEAPADQDEGVDLASFTLEFEGDFEFMFFATGELVSYYGWGTVVVAPLLIF